MTIIEKILCKYYKYCYLPSDSVFVESIDKYLGCAAEVAEHSESYVVLKLISDANIVKVKFAFKPLSYDNSRYVISDIKEQE